MSELAYQDGYSQASRQLDGVTDEIENSLRALRNVPRVLVRRGSRQAATAGLFGPRVAASTLP
jgi:hypothetical protein